MIHRLVEMLFRRHEPNDERSRQARVIRGLKVYSDAVLDKASDVTETERRLESYRHVRLRR